MRPVLVMGLPRTSGMTGAAAACPMQMPLRCFEGLRPADLPEDLQLISVATTEPPPQLAELWTPVGQLMARAAGAEAAEELLDLTSFMVIFCDVFDEAQAELFHQFLEWLDPMEEVPPLALLPVRTCGPDGKTLSDVLMNKGVLGTLIDDVILGQPSGHGLAFAIHASFAKLQRHAGSYLEQLQHRSERAREVQKREVNLDQTMWEYLPRKCNVPLPPIDYRLRDQDGRHFAGYAIGRRLRFGASWPVHEVRPTPGTAGAAAAGQGEVAVIITKSSVEKSICALRKLDRTWQIMDTLSTAWAHPNIPRAHQIYHSPTRLYMRMESYGNENLYSRLRGVREKAGCSLSLRQVRSIVVQLARVVNHLHTGPRICHRDIKPENIALLENGETSINVKLVNFESAMVQRPGTQCKSKSGTIPFVAPEMVDGAYDGMAADMWSVGMVLLEIAGGARIIDRWVFNWKPGPEGQAAGRPAERIQGQEVQQVKDALTDGAFIHKILLASSAIGFLQSLPWYVCAVRGLVRVAAGERLGSERLVRALQEQLGDQV